MKRVKLILIVSALLVTMCSCTAQGGSDNTVSEISSASAESSAESSFDESSEESSDESSDEESSEDESSDDESSDAESSNDESSDDESSDDESSYEESSIVESSPDDESDAESSGIDVSEESSERPESSKSDAPSQPVSIDDCSVHIGDVIHNSGASLPEVRISYNDSLLTQNEDYYISGHDDDSASIGKHSLTVTMEGSFHGSKLYYYHVFPETTVITYTSADENAISAEWSSVPEADGYQLEFSTSSDFGSGTESVNTDSTSFSLYYFESNTTYYFRVRSYKVSGSERLFSHWSEAKTAKYIESYSGQSGELQEIDGVTYIDGILIVNKTYSIPSTYGYGLTSETSSAFYQMQADAARDGISLWIASGYRSYQTQASTYQYFVWERGVAGADRCSARPGHSEHQTGLAIDVNNTSDSFAGTPAAIWLENHCTDYGFIIRYPRGKEEITGYKYEPWHIRYIGVEKAKQITATGLTIEEYYGITSQYNY